jgi:D-beta-D-heptose 7-phosphate kinase/D-beta-D-heptose 1-phosphate adenosyltransferase
VTVFEEDTPLELLREVRPDVIVKGGDYATGGVVGAEFAGRVEVAPLVQGTSTTALVNGRRALLGIQRAQHGDAAIS